MVIMGQLGSENGSKKGQKKSVGKSELCAGGVSGRKCICEHGDMERTHMSSGKRAYLWRCTRRNQRTQAKEALERIERNDSSETT